MNVVILEGRVVRDIELKQTQSGVPVVSFTLAVNRQYKSGEDAQADFINIVAWRHSAEFAAKYFKKGDGMSVVGSIQTRSYTDNEGQSRNAFEIVAQNIEFPISKAKDKTQNNTENNTVLQTNENIADNIGNEDDLPF